MSRVLGVIPARLGSTRLQRKPLQPLAGVPLVVWVWDRVRRMTCLDRVVVATDAPEVATTCVDWGAEVMMTSAEHPSGTDRVWEAAERLDEVYPVVVNVQGDEPLVDCDHVHGAVGLLASGYDVATCATRITSETEFSDPAVVKVVRRTDGSALYFSRAAIPHRRLNPSNGRDQGGGLRLRHVGIYAYARGALRTWVSTEPSPLEREESLEQLRALQVGLQIGVAVVDDAESGVDTPEDLMRMEQRLRALGVSPPVKTV